MTEPNEPSSETHHDEPPPGVRAMAMVRWVLVAAMAVVAALSVAYSFGLLPAARATTSETQYYCPMHPQVVQDHPGECPICSMSLVAKRSADGAAKPQASSATAKAADAGSHAGHRHDPRDPYYCPMHPEETGETASARCPICEMKLERRAAGQSPIAPRASQGVPGLVPIQLALDRVQLIGVRTAPAITAELVPEIRTVGIVTVDEAKVARVHTRFSGWVEQLSVATTGQRVRKGQTLASVYNLDLLPAQQEFLAARQWNNARPAHPAPRGATDLAGPLENDARARLELLGMSAAEIESIAQTGKPARSVAVSAPRDGHVLRKSVVQGAYVQPGMELFEIADLSRVWVLADVYEYDAARVARGQKAHVEVSSYPGERVTGKIGFVYPTVDSQTRTLRVRIELANAELKFRPGMYSDVRVELGEATGVMVPREAVVDTGEHQYVFMAKEGGRFEPRRVRVGTRSDDRAQILEGVVAGEVVVTTANFLLDSESRLRAALEGSASPGSETPAAMSACDGDFDAAKYPEKHRRCRECERVHRGMGTMEEDCKRAIARPWR